MDKVKITYHKEICEKLTETYEAKNADYGDSFSETRKKYPEAICIRLLDKMNRLESLISGRDPKVDESIDDTLLDLANYAVMELVERRYDSEEEVTFSIPVGKPVDNLDPIVSELICVKCGKRWIGVRVQDLWLKELECPGCKETGYVIETGQNLNLGDDE